MIASVYIKDGNIHLYNEYSENRNLSNIGGLAYELGRPLLNFVCYEPERFEDGFNIVTEAFDNEFAHVGANDPEFISQLKELMSEFQQEEVYLFFYKQILMDFIYDFIDSPYDAVMLLADKMPLAKEKLSWALDFKWPSSQSSFIQVVQYADKDKKLFRAAKDVVALMSEDIKQKWDSMINEVELLLSFREVMDTPKQSPLEYLHMIELYRFEETGHYFYLENPFKTFYGVLPSQEVVQLYEIHTIDDLFRFEFVKMIEHNIFIKKCKNCNHFFMPRRRVDAEYCDRFWNNGSKRCSEIGATLRYEKKVAGNPILEAHKKAYRRLHSRVRTKKMSNAEFNVWCIEANSRRDACLAGELAFEEFVEWLEQGRVRKPRSSLQD